MLPKQWHEFNGDYTRCALEMPCGIACYVGDAADGWNFTGTHAGAVGSVDEARAWLRGEAVTLLRVHDAGPDAS